jgi:hypothetical protein
MSRASADEILRVLDQGARDFIFPMLDNGYVYLAASRLSLFASDEDWAMVFEIFGYSPREGIPDLMVTAFTSRPVRTRSVADYVSDEAWQGHLGLYAQVEQTAFFPIECDDWLDPDMSEQVAAGASSLVLRGRRILLPDEEAYRNAGITLEQPDRPMVFELARALAFHHRDQVLATQAELRTHLVPELTPLLVLDDWHHPNVVDEDAPPSSTETFRQFAEVLSCADPSLYRSSETPNTHWSNWPDGGTL